MSCQARHVSNVESKGSSHKEDIRALRAAAPVAMLAKLFEFLNSPSSLLHLGSIVQMQVRLLLHPTHLVSAMLPVVPNKQTLGHRNIDIAKFL